MHITPDDGTHPDTALLADLDVADHVRAVVDEGRRMNAGRDPPVGTKHTGIITIGELVNE
jgi:hypothetical protein